MSPTHPAPASPSSPQSTEVRAPRLPPDPNASRNQRRTVALVACAVVTVAAGALAIISTTGYEHTPDFVAVVNGDERLKEFTRLSDSEVRQIARRVCVDMELGGSTHRIADALTADLHLAGVAGTSFVDAAIEHGCPEYATA